MEKESSELRASLGEVEAARLETRRALHDVKRQLKSVDAESCRLRQEINDVEARDRRREERLELTLRENRQLTQMVSDDSFQLF